MYIEDVDEFDKLCDIIASIFKAMKWKWKDKTPDKHDIKKSIIEKIKRISETNIKSISTGRIAVKKNDIGYTVYIEIAELSDDVNMVGEIHAN